MKNIIELLEESPIVTAVKNDEGLEGACKTDSNVVFILYGTIMTIPDIVKKVQKSGKLAIVHTDMIVGLSSKEVAVDFIKESTHAEGIISTKPMQIKRAKELGLLGIQRTFVIDSMAFDTMKKQIAQYNPDAIEIMPGIMPGIISELRQETDIPIIAGGLIKSKKDFVSALEAGADGISTTASALWEA